MLCGMNFRNAYAERELQADSVVKESFTTAGGGKNYATRFVDPHVIILVGNAVKSQGESKFLLRATQVDRRLSSSHPPASEFP